MTELSSADIPLIVVVAASATARSLVAGQLERRYPADYRIVVSANVDEAISVLRQAQADHRELALVLADEPGSEAPESLFVLARHLFPESRRGLLIEWGSWAQRTTAGRVLELMATNRIDSYVVVPHQRRNEGFHRTVTELLHDWERALGTVTGTGALTVIGDDRQPRTHEIRRFLSRAAVPFESVTVSTPAPPSVRLGDGQVLVAPENRQLAHAIGLNTEVPTEDVVDVAVVGAGPAGLAAAVYAASEGLNTLVVERDVVGGQAGSSSLIRNYLGFSRGISGADLSQRAYQQAWTFGARFAHTREVTGITTERGDFLLRIAPDEEVRARAIVLATGVTYRRLALAGLDPWVGSAVFYGVSAVEAKAQLGRVVHIVGGGNSAGQAALHLARYASAVSLIVRGVTLADSMSQYLVDQLTAAGVSILTESKVVGGGGESGHLEHLVVRHLRSGDETVVPSDALFITIGAAPHTQWLASDVLRDQWGFVLTGQDVLTEGGRRAWPHARPPAALESSVPGFFAVGDVRRASVKRVANAVGEGSVVVSSVHAYLAERVPAGERPR